MTGREKADADWNSQIGLYHVCGSIAAGRPELSHGRVFFAISLGCDASSDREAFCTEYNGRLDELIGEHGIPPWAPVNRIPDREECLKLLCAGYPDLESPSLRPVERRALHRIFDQRKMQGIGNARIAVDKIRRVSLIGGDAGARAGAVDIVDLESGRYMRRHEYRRRHCPTFPWDEAFAPE